MRRDDLCEAIRQTLMRLPDPFSAHYGVVPPAPPESSIDLGALHSRYDLAVRRLGQIEEITENRHNAFLISRVLSRQEAVSSSAIEGTNSTLDELLSLEQTSDAGASDASRQVHSYAQTLDRWLPDASRKGPDIFTDALLSSLHRAVMEDDPHYRDVPGQIRQVVVWIGGRDIATSTYNPPPPDLVPACLAQSLDYMRCHGMQSMTQGLIARMAVSHAHFEAIHPYRDGNGRAGRLLLPLMMAADGRAPLYLSPYIEANKAAYAKALKAAQQRLDWPEIVAFMSDAVVGAADELLRTLEALKRLREIWKTRRKFRAGSAALDAVALLAVFPVVTVTRFSEELGLSFPAAGNVVRQMVEAGILTERTGYARNRLFVAQEALSIINRPFGDEPILPGRI